MRVRLERRTDNTYIEKKAYSYIVTNFLTIALHTACLYPKHKHSCLPHDIYSAKALCMQVQGSAKETRFWTKQVERRGQL